MLIKFFGSLLFAAFLAVMSCTSAPVNKEPGNTGKQPSSPQNQTETTARTPLPANDTAAGKDQPKSDSKQTPNQLVEDLYHDHDSENSPFFQDKKRALVDKYFTKTTADVIWKDAVASKGEVGALDADPLYDAQDTEVRDFKIAPAVITENRATITVTFSNFDEKQSIKFLLLNENDLWKIEDIDYGKYTLLKLYRENS